MTTQHAGAKRYEVIVWDFDGAPDAAEYFSDDYSDAELAESILPYYCAKRWKTNSLTVAIDEAYSAVEDKCMVGAAVFEGEKKIEGFGLTFSYKQKYR